ncbi:hypothetical protein ACVV2G_26940 [Streptomyces ziwulingensis]
MAGAADEGPHGSHRSWTAVRVAGMLLSTAAVGFAVGALAEDGRHRLWSGAIVAAIGSVLTAVVLAVVLRREGRRARRFGLNAGQLLRISQDVRRGRPPADPAVRPAVLDVLGRQRRALDLQRRRAYRWVQRGLVTLWSLVAVAHVADGSYGFAAVMLLCVLCALAGPFTLRRQERRLDAVERSLGLPGSCDA